MANPTLTLREEPLGELQGATRLRLMGTLDVATISQLEGALSRLRVGGSSRVVVDLSGLEYISSSGLGSFLGIVDSFRREGGDLVFARLSERVKKIFKVVGFYRVLTIVETEDEALRHFAKAQTAELAGFAFSGDGEKPHSGEAFVIEIRALDSAGVPSLSFMGEAALRASVGIVSPAKVGPFKQGIWRGPIILTGPGNVALTASEGDVSGEGLFSVVETKEPAQLPTKVACPGCGAEIEITAFNVYRCNDCDEIYFVDKWAHAISLRKGAAHRAAESRMVRCSFPADVNLLSTVRIFLAHVLKQSGYPEDAVGDIELCADEAVTNVVEHAYQYDPRYSVTLEIVMEPKRLTLRVRDQGKPFDPRGRDRVDLDQHIAERRTGGLGVYLMHTFMNKVDYRREGQENVLELVKDIEAKPRSGGAS